MTLGFRRKAFRQRPGELDYDFCVRRRMEKQERKRLTGGKTIWLGSMGPYQGNNIGKAEVVD